MYSRRTFGKLALTAVPISAAFAKVNSKISGVQIGAQSYSFRDRPLDAAIKGMVDVGLGECELWQGHVEPQKVGRDELRKWRLTVSMEEFRKVREKFDKAGIDLYAYNYSFNDRFDDEEIARGFEMAKALGVKRLTSSSQVTTAARVYPYAEKAKVYVGFHNHSSTQPNEIATPESFEEAMRGRTPWIAINLDIGHFVARGYDPVEFIKKHHEHILTLHIKDRKKDQGPNVPFGEGDTPIKAVLQLLRDNHYQIPANIEYEYQGGDTVEEVRKCFEYCKRALA